MKFFIKDFLENRNLEKLESKQEKSWTKNKKIVKK